MRIWPYIGLIAFCLLASSCARGPLRFAPRAPIANIPHVGAWPMPGMTDVTYANEIANQQIIEIPYDPSDIEIVGWFENASASSGVTGRAPGVGSGDLVGVRHSDYAATFRAMLDAHDLDGLLNKVVDTDRWVLNLYFIRFTRQETRLGGVGFRFRDEALRERIR